MQASAFDEAAFLRAVGGSGARSLVIGRLENIRLLITLRKVGEA